MRLTLLTFALILQSTQAASLDSCFEAFSPPFSWRLETMELERVQMNRLLNLGERYGLKADVAQRLDMRLSFDGIGQSGEINLKSFGSIDVPPSAKDDILFASERYQATKIEVNTNAPELWDRMRGRGDGTTGFQLSPSSQELSKIRAYQDELARIYQAGQMSGLDPIKLKNIYQDLYKMEQVAALFEGRVSSLNLSFLMGLPGDIKLPRYFYSANSQYSALRAGQREGVDYLLYDATKMKSADKQSFENAFDSFVDHLYHDTLPSGNTKKYARNFTYMDEGDVQYGLHIFNPAAMKLHPGNVPRQYKNLASDIRKFVAREYSNRMGITVGDLQTLMRISKSVENRTLSVVSTRQGFAKIKLGESSPELLGMRSIKMDDFGHFEIEGAVSAVHSSSNAEKLPLEMFTGFEIPRHSPDEILVEIGRFTVVGDKVTSDAFIRSAAALTRNIEGASRVIIEADAARARLFKRFGFKPIHKRTNFEGKTEFIMEVTPQELYQKVQESLTR